MLVQVLLLPLLFLGPVRAQEPRHDEVGDHGHDDDFASMLEHRAFPDLMRWKERHPWRVGTEIRKFVLRFEAERAKGDPEVDRVWDMHAAFLAEVLADDVCSEWLITVLRFDVLTRARFDTVRAGLADIAASIATNKDATDDSILAEVEELRPPIAPPWCFESCVEELTRIAEAAQTTGHGKAAVEIARQARVIAEKTHDGEIALWCATFLMRAELEAGQRNEADMEVRLILEAAGGVERLPEDFEKTLAAIHDGFGHDSAIAIGIQSFRAVRAQHEGKDDEALSLWTAATRDSIPHRAFHMINPPLSSIENVLCGPDPARRGTILAARTGRFEEAWELARVAFAPGMQGKPFAAANMKEQLDALRLNGVLALVADRAETVAVWFDFQGPRAKVLPIGLVGIQALVDQVQESVRDASQKKGEPSTTPFNPTSARQAYRALIEPLGPPWRGRIGVFVTTELSALPLGMLVVEDAPSTTATTKPARPRFLVETATLVRMAGGGRGWEVDDATLEAVTNRINTLEAQSGNRADAVHAVQLEMIDGLGPLGTGRSHPWYWAGLELGPPR